MQEKTAAANVLEWGTGGINVDACRVETAEVKQKDHVQKPHDEFGTFIERGGRARSVGSGAVHDAGRWPPNLLLSEEAAAEMDAQSGITTSTGGSGSKSGKIAANVYGTFAQSVAGANAGGVGDTGGASRYFPVFKYQAKAPAKERPKVDGISHPTCKPLGLMRWLVRLVTPPGGICLDLFAGSGTTGEACLDEGFNCILIEREPDYIKLIRERLDRREPTLWE